MRMAFVLAALLWCGAPLADEELTPEKAAKIDRDTDKALKAVDQKFGNKKSSELTGDERKQVIAERAAAEREVLARHNVEARAYTQYTARQSKAERAATKLAGEALEAKEKAAEADKAKESQAAPAPKEIPIQRGGAGKDPIIMEEKEGAPPIVEKGLPQEAKDDQTAAGLTESAPAPSATKPKAKSKGR